MQNAIFSNSSNFVIFDGKFVQNVQNTVQNSTGKPRTYFQVFLISVPSKWIPQFLALNLLREHCALNALLDAKERFDPPRCAPETRVAIIKDIIDWVEENEQSASSILWLHGPAGAGKSAIAQTIAQNCKDNGLLVASHFFSRTSSTERSDGDRVIPNLTLQLLQAFPVIERHIEGVILKDPGIFHRLRSIQMEELVIRPWHCRRLTRLHFMRKWLLRFQRYLSEHQTDNGRLIVIDGLDECSDPEVQCDLLRIIASACTRIPLPLRFLIASRPEIHIERTFGSEVFELIRVKRINLGDDPDANLEIQRYLLREFERIHKNHRFGADFHPTEDMIAILVEKSSAQFIYPSTVIKYIEDPRGRPDKRLEVIMGISSPRVNNRPFAQLDALYMHIFFSANSIHSDAIRSIFGIIFLASKPKYDYLKPGLAFLELALNLETREIILLLDDFVSLIALPEDPAQPIRSFHAGLLDFLCDPERSGEFTLDLSVAHEVVATYFSRRLNEDNPLSELFSVYVQANLLKNNNRCHYHLSSFAFAFQRS